MLRKQILTTRDLELYQGYESLDGNDGCATSCHQPPEEGRMQREAIVAISCHPATVGVFALFRNGTRRISRNGTVRS